MFECVCPDRKYSITIVKATTVRLRVVYMGMFIPRTASMVTTYHQIENGCRKLMSFYCQGKKAQNAYNLQVLTIKSK